VLLHQGEYPLGLLGPFIGDFLEQAFIAGHEGERASPTKGNSNRRSAFGFDMVLLLLLVEVSRARQ
jgi:hypothetical protein